jgi:hypothetical protein
MVRDALGSRARFEPLPVSHPLYHCRFDFADGPPQGMEMSRMLSTDTTDICGGQARAMSMANPVLYLEGIYVDGRLAGVYSNKGYSNHWMRVYDNDPQLKIGVNLAVYALTRGDGMNERTMARYTGIR